MNSLDILLYIVLTVGTLYALWIILRLTWFGILSVYYKITDEISFHKWKDRVGIK